MPGSPTSLRPLTPARHAALPVGATVRSPTAARGVAATSRPTGRRRRRRSQPAWLWSLSFHVALLLVCLRLTFATGTGHQLALWVEPLAPFDEQDEVLQPLQIEPPEWQPPAADEAEVDGPRLADVRGPLSQLVDAPPTLTPIVGPSGLVGMMPADVGLLMSSGEGDEPGVPGGGGAAFFGTRTKGSRFVFVIDNSRSMKDGRLEVAVAELLASVEGMSRRQSFYVIFVSDQPYPMFFPEPAPGLVPATKANRNRLRQWLTRLQLAPGKNRELIPAMDLAASLRPHAVFLLWDGDLRYSERVRTDVMLHLASPNQWAFPVHTVCMGDQPIANQQNLAEVARVHGGIYRRVDVPLPGRR